MKSALQICFNLVKEAVRFPRLMPEWNGDRLSKVVQLQSTAANGIHDGSIVDHCVLDTQLNSTENQISVGGSTAGDKIVKILISAD